MLRQSRSPLDAPSAARGARALRLDAGGKYLAAVEALMHALCNDPHDDEELGRITWEHIASGGKRLRARLAVVAVEALGADPASGVAWGASCELLHNASLIHDDLQDGDRYRRGKPSLWARYGAAQAINAGDLCITLGYAALGAVPGSDTLRWRLTELVSRASRIVVAGQAAELRLLAQGVSEWSRYAACVEGKTAALFAMPVEGAAILAGRPPEEAAALAAAFLPLGLLFQIQDDLLDLFGDNGRDRPGSDISQANKATALVVEHLRLHPEDRAWLLDILSAPREATPPQVVDEVIARFRHGGALAAVWRRVEAIQTALASSAALRREPALGNLAERFAAEALAPVAHTRPGPR